MSDGESVERELKFHCPDLEGLRERLHELEAERIAATALEDNQIIDRDGELQTNGLLLRLRNDQQGASLTFKGKARFEDDVKVRTEYQTGLSDADQLTHILENLGYRRVRRYQKKREEWRLGGVVVALDRTPIGDFAEFEGDRAGDVARRCGFEPGEAERRTYLQLYDDYLEEHPEAPADMVFP